MKRAFFILSLLIFFQIFSIPAFAGGEKWGIVIGISKYKDHNLLPLKYPEKDALEFKKILTEHVGVEEDNIKTLIGPDATRFNIKNAIYEYLKEKCSPEDEVYIFFSGYGTFIKDANGDEKDGLDECLIPYDGKVSVKECNYIIDDELANWLKAIKSNNIVIILDAEKAEGMDDFLNTRKGVTLITSASSKQTIREESELNGGTFMHFFKEAIEKEGNNDSNEITLKEIFNYVKKKVVEYTKSHKYEETPVMKGKTEKEISFSRFTVSPWKGSPGVIAFSSDIDVNQDIYLMNSDGSRKVNLTRDKGKNFSPVWSPDGKKLAFISNRTGNFDIFSVDIDGKNLINLTNSPQNNYMPSWSPDGKQLLFTLRDGEKESVFLVKSDGTSQSRLTTGTSWKDTKPLWCPDGKKIAFLSNRTGFNEIYTVNPMGTELVNLTDNHLEKIDFLWSPDGGKMGFIARKNGQTDLYIMNSDGSGQKNLTNDPGVKYDFSWSPDGKKIAFTTTAYTDKIANLCILNLEDGKITKLTSDEVWKRSPAWSPDSSRIVFCAGAKSPNFIYGINIDGTGLVKLVGGNANNQEPAWANIVDLHL